jgi:capsule polysaccharide modification protein KpsS
VYASPYKLIIEKGVVNDFNKIPSELEINTYLNQNNFTSCRTSIFQPTIFTGLASNILLIYLIQFSFIYFFVSYFMWYFG